jgi:protein-L-isoaspartate(D-aspartate) O-methyltransferase
MTSPDTPTDERRAERERMVRTQVAARGVEAPAVLAAMREIPRELFVPGDLAADAYADRALAIGLGQTISQPYMVAVMTASLHVDGNARVLEVGTGSGYHAAVLSRIAREVISMERHAELADRARAILAALGCDNVEVIVGDGTLGHAAGAPYAGILVTAGAPAVPEALLQQLQQGGRLVIPVGTAHSQSLTGFTRRGDGFEQQAGEPCVFVPLIGQHGWHA